MEYWIWICIAIALVCFVLGFAVVWLISLLLRRKRKEPKLIQEEVAAKVRPLCNTVKFVLNNDSGQTVSVLVEPTATVLGLVPAASKTGHSFLHWYASDAEEKEAFDLKTPITTNITLVAYYTLNSYSVTVNNASYAVEGAMPRDDKVEFGRRVDLMPNIASHGYQFARFSGSVATVYDPVRKAHYFIMPNKAVWLGAEFELIHQEPVVYSRSQPILQSHSYVQPIFQSQYVTQPVHQAVVQPALQPQPIAQPVTQPIVRSDEESEKEPDKLLFFTLSRNDVMDHVLEMQRNSRFPIKPKVNEKTNEKMPDFLMCNDWCFGMMFSRNNIVFNFILHMNDEIAAHYGKRYDLRKVSSMAGEYWYSLAIDRSFESKREVYIILDECCEFTLSDGVSKRKKESAEEKAEKTSIQAELEKKMTEKISILEKDAADAERKYRAELKKFKSEHYIKLLITRQEIATEMRRLENPDIEVIERPQQPQLPWSLKFKGKTYAMLHGTEAGVLMIVRIANEYADLLIYKHPELCRAKFPKGANWYQLPIDGAFANKDAVYRVLNAARGFVERKVVEAEVEAKMKDKLSKLKVGTKASPPL